MAQTVLPPHLEEHDCGLWFIMTRAPWWTVKAHAHLIFKASTIPGKLGSFAFTALFAAPLLLLLWALTLSPSPGRELWTLFALLYLTAQLAAIPLLYIIRYLSPKYRYYRAQDGTALLAVKAHAGSWHVDDHVAAKVKQGYGKKFRATLLPKLAEHARQVTPHVRIELTSAGRSLALRYAREAAELRMPLRIQPTLMKMPGWTRLVHDPATHPTR